MHALRFDIRLVATTALLFSSFASAGPVLPRQEDPISESPLDPWVSVDASGTAIATFTPILTSVNGVATTIDAAPVAITATALATPTSTPSDSSQTTSTEEPAAASTTGGSYQVCHNRDGFHAPFCKPDNGSAVYVGETYYVTWDTSYFGAENATLLFVVNYVNTSGGEIAMSSSPIKASQGFISWTIDKAWLHGLKSNNVTLYLNEVDPTVGESPSLGGPTVMVEYIPVAEPYHQPKASAPKGQSLYIALPVVFGFIIICLIGGFYWNRKHRQIGLGNVMGRRKGYGVGKSRTQRMGQGKKEGAIQLREQELTADGMYKDVSSPPPAKSRDIRDGGHARGDSEALGSLAGSPPERNVFRDEMRRQEQSKF